MNGSRKPYRLTVSVGPISMKNVTEAEQSTSNRHHPFCEHVVLVQRKYQAYTCAIFNHGMTVLHSPPELSSLVVIYPLDGPEKGIPQPPSKVITGLSLKLNWD
uniref:Uncharacterized protein n=1 Tax=Compsopogon caeruleus TaxID=31354 RepID=A0A7S1XC63_9RHOD|mmetsp:Transcript_13907/g.28471  ORF Transcript_13907/g.28471 Transcript_13907/m.28471 type:complete len:103 (+) Transcript_13907:745-1053(+)